MVTAFATALAALDTLRSAASDPGALAGLSKPKFKSMFGAVMALCETGSGTISVIDGGGCSCVQYPLAEQIQRRPAEHLPLQHLDPVDLPFNRTRTVRQPGSGAVGAAGIA